MKVLLLSGDTDYSNRIKHYFGKKYFDVHIYICDNVESVKLLSEKESFDVILFDSDFDNVKAEELGASLSSAAFAYISSTNEIVNEKDTIYKYRSVTELHSQICTLYEKKKNRIVRKNDTGEEKSTEIITFLPVHGGAGSSTMAAACAVSLAARDSVLYINLEEKPSDSAFFATDSKKGITEIISELKTKYTESSIYQLLKEIIQQDRKQKAAKVFCINGFNNILDVLSLTDQCIEILFKILRSKFDFKYIIVDTDSIVSKVLQRIIVSSDKLVFVSSDSDIADIKLSQINRYMELLKRDDENAVPESYLLLNQYYGMSNEGEVVHGMKVIGRFARYRTNDNTRITSQNIIDEVLSEADAFSKLID